MSSGGKTKRKMSSSLSGVGILWALLSFVCCGLSVCGFYLPYWLEGKMSNNITSVYFGTFRRCNYPILTKDGQIEIIEECGRYAEYKDIPSMSWQIASIIVGVGAGLTFIVALTSVLGCCISELVNRTIARVGGGLQLLAGLLIGAGCVLYPNGWNSIEVRAACGGTSAAYQLGTCNLAWAYYVTMAASGSALLCALLSCNASREMRTAHIYQV